MANTLEFTTLFQQKLDEQLIHGATSGWMENNAGQIIYNGGAEVKVPKMALDGLGDYGRNTTGYPRGDIDLAFETFTMRMDRAREFNFDRNDVDETNFAVNAAQVMSVFQKTHVIPEIDAYRYSSIAAVAAAASKTVSSTPTAADILSKLNEDITAVQDATGVDNLIISMSRLVYGVLTNSTELSRNLDAANFTQGNVQMQVKGIDGIPIVPVPSARFKTKYVFNDGLTAGQVTGGFVPDETAKDINWIICPITAPLALSKTDVVKVFSPDVNQDMDSWKTQYRKYHDLWLFENVINGIRVNLAEEAAAGGTGTEGDGTGGTGTEGDGTGGTGTEGDGTGGDGTEGDGTDG
jgi:hypothetical protein